VAAWKTRSRSVASKLRNELLELPVADVRLVSAGPPPPGARAAEALEAGALAVALVRSPGVVSSVGQALSAWISSRHGRSAVVQLGADRIELTGISEQDQARMLALFEHAHGGER
jgi:membrane-associated two-gene conflict system component 1 (EACC1)